MRAIFIAILFLFIAVQSEAAILTYGTSGTATTSYATIATACAAPNVKRIEVTSSYTLSGDLTCPADRTLYVKQGGVITISTGVTLAINGLFEAGLYQAFGGGGAVTGLKEARPEWFGGGVGVDSGSASNKALLSLSAGGKLSYGPGTYYTSIAILVPDNMTVQGAGLDRTFIKVVGASGSVNVFQNIQYSAYGGKSNPTVPDYSIKTPNYNIVVKNLTIDCNYPTVTQITNGLIFTLVDGLLIDSVKVINAKQKGIYVQSSKNVRIVNGAYYNNLLNGIHVTDCINVTVDSNTLNGNADYAIEMGAGDTISAPNAAIGLPTTYGGDSVISNNIILGGQTAGIYLRGLNTRAIKNANLFHNKVSDMTIKDIVADPSSGSGIVTSDLTSDIHIVNNTIKGCENSGIYVFYTNGTARYVIDDNILLDNTSYVPGSGIAYTMNINGLNASSIRHNTLIGNKASGTRLNYFINSVYEGNDAKSQGTVTPNYEIAVLNSKLSYIHNNKAIGSYNTNGIFDGTGNATNFEANIYAGNMFLSQVSNTTRLPSFGDYKVPTFGSGYSGSNVKFSKDINGLVHLFGTITKSSTGVLFETMITLGGAYKPTETKYFLVVNGTTTARIKINTSGVMEFVEGTATNPYYLDGIFWQTDI